MRKVKETTQGSMTKAGIQSTLDYLLGEIEHHKDVVTLLEQECIKLYAQLKVLDKENNNELR